MVKLSPLLLGAISGVAAAAFLTTKKGKEVLTHVSGFAQDLKEDPKGVKEQVIQTAKDFSDQAGQAVASVKEQVKNGTITTETVLNDVKKKSQETAQVAQNKLSSLKEKLQEQHLTSQDLFASLKKQAKDLTTKKSEADVTENQDIVIDLTDEHQEK